MEHSHMICRFGTVIFLTGTLLLLKANGMGMRPKGLASSSSSSFNPFTSSLDLSSPLSDVATAERNLLVFIRSCTGATSNAALGCPCAGNGKPCKDSLSICRNFKCICNSSISTYNSASNKCVAIASLSSSVTTTTNAPISTTRTTAQTATTTTTSTQTTTTTTSPNVPVCAAKSAPEIAYYPLTMPAPTTAQISEIVDVHNNFRKIAAAKNMRKLSWNACAASNAQYWANTCPSAHDGARKIPGFPQCGQNIAWNTGTTPYSWTQAIKLWYDEISSFHYCEAPTASPGNEDAVVGHYTQVMWASTSVIGCGMKTGCPAIPSLGLDPGPVNVYVCNYCEPGNLGTGTGTYPDSYCPWEPETSTSQRCAAGGCPSGTTCQDGLCA